MDGLANKEKTMKPFKQCPICSGELVNKEVEKLLRGGVDTAFLRVEAEVCLHCGERLYTEETVRQFEDVRQKLESRETGDFEPLGQSFQVVQ